MQKFELTSVCRELALEEHVLAEWIEAELVTPAEMEGPFFDEEDLSRLRLLCELRTMYGTNTSSLEVIMHLLDQVHLLQKTIKTLKRKN